MLIGKGRFESGGIYEGELGSDFTGQDAMCSRAAALRGRFRAGIPTGGRFNDGPRHYVGRTSSTAS